MVSQQCGHFWLVHRKVRIESFSLLAKAYSFQIQYFRVHHYLEFRPLVHVTLKKKSLRIFSTIVVGAYCTYIYQKIPQVLNCISCKLALSSTLLYTLHEVMSSTNSKIVRCRQTNKRVVCMIDYLIPILKRSTVVFFYNIY